MQDGLRVMAAAEANNEQAAAGVEAVCNKALRAEEEQPLQIAHRIDPSSLLGKRLEVVDVAATHTFLVE